MIRADLAARAVAIVRALAAKDPVATDRTDAYGDADDDRCELCAAYADHAPDSNHTVVCEDDCPHRLARALVAELDAPASAELALDAVPADLVEWATWIAQRGTGSMPRVSEASCRAWSGGALIDGVVFVDRATQASRHFTNAELLAHAEKSGR